MRLFLNRLHARYDADTGSEAGGNGGDPNPTPDPSGTETPPPTPETSPAFTQADIDKITAKYSDYDTVKTQLKTLLEAEEARKLEALTETERLAAERDAANQKVADLEAKSNAAIEAANKRLIAAEFRQKAVAMKVQPSAVDAAMKLADLSAATVSEDGTVSGVDDIIKSLTEANPFLIAASTTPNPIGDPSGGGDPKPDVSAAEQLKRAADLAKRTGSPDAIAAYMNLKDKLTKN